jgi:hypothetical protein
VDGLGKHRNTTNIQNRPLDNLESLRCGLMLSLEVVNAAAFAGAQKKTKMTLSSLGLCAKAYLAFIVRLTQDR